MENTEDFLKVIQDKLILDFLKYLKENQIVQAIDSISLDSNKAKFANEKIKNVKYFKNIAETLYEYKLSINGENFKGLGEIKPGVYEGGFKLWECEKDGVQYVLENGFSGIFDNQEISNKNVLEIGCGSGLFGILCLVYGVNSVSFQDFNSEVLKLWTIPNLALNIETLQDRVAFIEGDWADFNSKKLLDSGYLSFKEKISRKYDLIFGSDVLYETRNYQNLIKLFQANLTENGVVVISSKAYYYGNGGSIAEFKNYLDGSL